MANAVRIGRSAAEVARILANYETSGLTRSQYCRQIGLPVTSFDYYRRRQFEGASPQRLVRVDIGATPSHGQRPAGFTLVLSNGWRIESQWDFAEADLKRLLRLAEQV